MRLIQWDKFLPLPAWGMVRVHLSPVLFALFLNDFVKYDSCFGISLQLVLEYFIFTLSSLFCLMRMSHVSLVQIKLVSRRIYTYFMNMLDINYDTRNDDRFIFAMGENKISIFKEFKYHG